MLACYCSLLTVEITKSGYNNCTNYIFSGNLGLFLYKNKKNLIPLSKNKSRIPPAYFDTKIISFTHHAICSID